MVSIFDVFLSYPYISIENFNFDTWVFNVSVFFSFAWYEIDI